ncbi:MAG TPA: EF-hand domain-containing protein [Pirellulaceae bacterium]|nr:EF-hand domain-containing protein [Pirellulaceae bacterium]
MKRHLAWVVMMVLAASPSLAEDGKAKNPAGKRPAEGAGGPLNNPELMKRLLEKFDENKDGRLSPQEQAKAQEEFLKGAAQAGGPAFQEFLKKFDRDGDGKLNDRERAAAMEAAQKIRASGGGGGPQVGPPLTFAGNEIPAAILEKFDKDGDGKLNDEEMALAKKAQSGKRERAKKSDVIKEFDKDGDGKLNDEEKAAAKAAAKERKKKAE